VNDSNSLSTGRGDLPPAEWDDLVVGPERSNGAGPVPALVVGIVGDSGSGKSTVADAVAGLLGRDRVADFRLDDYHRFTRQERAERGVSSLHPSVHNLLLMQEHLALLRSGQPVLTRSYSHGDGTFGPVRTIEPRDVVLARGLLGFPTSELEGLYDLSVFLRPEPELLFRWKLRRDVLFRGYTEAEVLKYIADHLLDAKEFVLPQAELADIVVEYALPDPEAPDTEVHTTMRLRRAAGELAGSNGIFDALPVERTCEGGEVVVRFGTEVPESAVEEWASQRLTCCGGLGDAGAYHDETGQVRRRASLALVEVLIAYFGQRMVGNNSSV
jgi:uridine kinase